MHELTRLVEEHADDWHVDRVTGQTYTNNLRKSACTLRDPIVVCGAIVPLNLPLAMAAYQIDPTLAAGDVIALKAAEQTPLSALLMALEEQQGPVSWSTQTLITFLLPAHRQQVKIFSSGRLRQ